MSTAHLRQLRALRAQLEPDAHKEALSALVIWLEGGPTSEDEKDLFARVVARGGGDRLSGLAAWLSEEPAGTAKQIREGS